MYDVSTPDIVSYTLVYYYRTLPDLDLLRVSGNGDIYMIQTYAEVTGISPPLGSTEGGLRLTVTGKNFDTNVKVTIGGRFLLNILNVNGYFR